MEIKVNQKNFLIGVISDTHLPRRAQTIPKKIVLALRKADIIIHLGDIEIPELFLTFFKKARSRIYFLKGDHDKKGHFYHPFISVVIKKRQFFFYHGGANLNDFVVDNLLGRILRRQDILNKVIAKRSLKLAFSEGLIPKYIVFGHSHLASLWSEKGITFLNPGSTLGKKRQKTAGLIKFSGQKIDIEIIKA